MAAQVNAVALPPPVRLQGAAHPLPERLGVGVGAQRVLSEILALTLEELHATVLHLETDRQKVARRRRTRQQLGYTRD